MSDDATRLYSGEAWAESCDRLRALGLSLLGPGYPKDPRERAEGFRALTRQLAFALQMEVEASDPGAPTFLRYQEPQLQWGGPNPDNVYLRAAIDPTATYRVWGNVSGVRQALFSLHEGDMQLEQYGVYGERSLDELAKAPDGSLELVLAPGEQPGNWIPMHPQARFFLIRVYLSDWERDASPGFQIARVDREGVPAPPLEPAALARSLDRAVTWVERSLAYWNRYTMESCARAKPNEAAPARSAPGGADNILYGSCFWDLAEDEALLLACERPDADYWGFALHTLHWLESGDFASRQTSLSGDQAHVDADGRVRLVVAHRDPGVPNWLDTEGHRRGMLAYRFVRARSGAVPQARVVALGALRAELPAAHPGVAPEERRARLARRREAYWARNRPGNADAHGRVEDHKRAFAAYFDALGRADRAAMRALVTDDLVWVVPPSAPAPFGGVHRGADAVIDMMLGAVSGAFLPGSQRTEFRVAVGEGDAVMAEARIRARAAHAEYENWYCFVVEFRGGRIAEIREHVDTIPAARFFAPGPG
jgi:ketosteroid isomerase-like protein